jgi:lipopolysaccharide transport system permease protein
MYASPVAYSTTIVPEKWLWLYNLNPMVGVIEGFRWALLGKSAPDVKMMIISMIIILVIFGGGLLYFSKKAEIFADII